MRAQGAGHADRGVPGAEAAGAGRGAADRRRWAVPEPARGAGARRRRGAQDIVFTGSVPWPELPAHYAAGDVFAMPCRTRRGGLDVEGLGIVYLEASATGLPVVAGDSGGAPDAVLPGRDRLGGARRRRRLRRSWCSGWPSCSATPSCAATVGQRGRAWVQDEWSWERQVERLRGLVTLASGSRALCRLCSAHLVAGSSRVGLAGRRAEGVDDRRRSPRDGYDHEAVLDGTRAVVVDGLQVILTLRSGEGRPPVSDRPSLMQYTLQVASAQSPGRCRRPGADLVAGVRRRRSGCSHRGRRRRRR